ncbi:TonB-dependent receptor [Sediminicola luteus]|uniref:TonB-dependent receptor n=1 Tax=Sediminicola luteus TaxID=319238 RepID=A0A2A4GAP3_9FLAO|nr:carboxypeptidase-like regulatory domain-containing protein [Sediminicola luteus]PCE65056.1 TonB-dependent receptor [Sediminicola luteus]
MRFLYFLLLLPFFTQAQSEISGTVTDTKGVPVLGANVYLQGTYDGASTDENGKFHFETEETGTQTLVVSMLSFDEYVMAGDVGYFKEVDVKLVEALNTLTGVTLTAGTFEAGDNSKVSVLKPLDIVTTAGAAGDFVGALQTLPGTSTVNEDGRLFVRGGEAGETQVFIDGLRVFQPFGATPNNIPTRGRFSPFLFKGITFSTGGYAAEYGQALSSVLLLNTTDFPEQEKTDISIMSVGGGIGHTEIWGENSLSVNASYINLAPYESLIPSDQGVRWNDPVQALSGEAVYRNKTDKGMLKVYGGYSFSDLDIAQEDINFDEYVNFALKNNNMYLNTNYRHFFENDWSLFTGGSISYDRNRIGLDTGKVNAEEKGLHVKSRIKKSFSNRFSISSGVEYFITDYQDRFTDTENNRFESGYTDNIGAFFAETDIFFNNDFALKAGARVGYSSLLKETQFSPRLSLAHTIGGHGQVSLAYGGYWQAPLRDYLKYDSGLTTEKTRHFILNYQYLNKGKTFRAETYYKAYRDLVKYDTDLPMFNSDFSNSGDGYATGLDLFWRDNNGIKNLDYWASYSYLDTKRDYRNFESEAVPSFAPKHNLSLVGKYFVSKWRSQIGLSYSFASGRTYDNPNSDGFMVDKTKAYNNLSVNWAYLLSQQKILYFSISNVAGFNNVNGYQYANEPNMMGTFDRLAIRPAADTFFFVGFFWTISKDKSSNQLDNL